VCSALQTVRHSHRKCSPVHDGDSYPRRFPRRAGGGSEPRPPRCAVDRGAYRPGERALVATAQAADCTPTASIPVARRHACPNMGICWRIVGHRHVSLILGRPFHSLMRRSAVTVTTDVRTGTRSGRSLPRWREAIRNPWRRVPGMRVITSVNRDELPDGRGGGLRRDDPAGPGRPSRHHESRC